MSAAGVRGTIDRLLAAQRRLAQHPVDRIIDSLDRCLVAWLDSDSPWRRRAEAALPTHTGFSPEMIRHALPLMLAPLRGAAVARLIDEELGDRHRLDDPAPAKPRLIVHVLPGNIPGLAVSAVCLSLAMKSAALIKPGAGDRCFPALFADSLAETDVDLGQCVAAVYWPGGDLAIETAAFERATVVEAAGTDAAVAALRARVPGRFVGHGSKISFAAVGREIAQDQPRRVAAARALAEDISIWDQLGCLSPQVVFVEADGIANLEPFADALATELDAMAISLPPRRLTFEEQLEIRRFRDEAEWSPSTGCGRLLSGPSLSWAILLEDAPALWPTCLHRTVRLQPVARLDDVAALLNPLARCLEAAGLAIAPERHASLAAALRAAGVHRVCAAGEMQRPDLTWKPGGQPRVGAWIE